MDKETSQTLTGKPGIVLITGASGTGKTAVTRELAKRLPAEAVSINYFDDIGIPPYEEMVTLYGSGEKWQEQATHAWVEKLSKMRNKNLIILEGSFNPQFAIDKIQALGIQNFLLICLHAERNVREKRLLEERNQPELVTQDMENFAQFLKNKTLELKGELIETSAAALTIIAQEIFNLLAKKRR